MIKTARQLKDLVRNKTSGNSLESQTLIRNYIMERFLERLSVSEFREHFILKGGMLISAVVGIDKRSTMDIDTTLKNITLDIHTATETVKKIISIEINDNVTFIIKKVSEIMEESEYGGIRISLEANFDTMTIPIKVDMSTGDVITPMEVEYQFKLMFEERSIQILSYNIETVLAEKFESILSKSTANTRMRDFYDIYAITTYHKYLYDEVALKEAFWATCNKRKSLVAVEHRVDTVSVISSSDEMQDLWRKYQDKFSYAKDITWGMIMEVVIKEVSLF